MSGKAEKDRSKAEKETIIHLQRPIHREMAIFPLVISEGSIRERIMIINDKDGYIIKNYIK